MDLFQYIKKNPNNSLKVLTMPHYKPSSLMTSQQNSPEASPKTQASVEKPSPAITTTALSPAATPDTPPSSNTARHQIRRRHHPRNNALLREGAPAVAPPRPGGMVQGQGSPRQGSRIVVRVPRRFRLRTCRGSRGTGVRA